MSVSCPTKSDILDNTCTWNLSTTPIYRQVYEYYYITMNASNELGNVTFPSIKFHHYAHSEFLYFLHTAISFLNTEICVPQ